MGTPKNRHARRYYRVARQRLDEAEIILITAKLPAASEYLAGYAVECILKALLLVLVPASEHPDDWKDVVDWIKRNFGHDLNELRNEIGRRGSNLPKTENDALDYVVENWNPESRYNPGPGKFTHATEFLAQVRILVEWADRSI